MKIKDTKIAEKLPSTGNGFTLGAKQDVLNTDIDANECVEVDVEAVSDIVFCYEKFPIETFEEKYGTFCLEDAIASAGIIKWREK